jgi:hypothetical protein
MNATELAAWLSGQGNVGVEDAAKSAAATPSGTASALSMKPGSSVSQTSSPVRTATKTTSKRTAPQATVADSIEYTAQEILDILSEATGFNGAALSRSLSNGTHAAYLSQFTPSAGGAGKISSRGNVMSRSSGTSSRTPKAPVGGGKASVADSVEVDIDSIIAEGVERYGEEVFLDIIADFDATGEMSQELFDLLG